MKNVLKQFVPGIIACLMVAMLSLVVNLNHVGAQTTPVFQAPSNSWLPPVATAVGQCPTLAAHTGGTCPVEATAGVISYYDWTGSGWTLRVNGGGTAAGVLTFNGHKPDASGNIVPAAGDYTCAQVTGCATNPVLTVNGHSGPAVTLGATTTAPASTTTSTTTTAAPTTTIQ